MTDRDISVRLNEAIAAGLIRAGLNFLSQTFGEEGGEHHRAWILQISNAESPTPIRVTLIGANNLLAAVVHLRPSGDVNALRSAIGTMLVETVPFVRVAPDDDLLMLRAEFPIDRDAAVPVAAATVAAAVHSVAIAAFKVLQSHPHAVEHAISNQVHVPQWNWLPSTSVALGSPSDS